jgi:beta-glucosidase
MMKSIKLRNVLAGLVCIATAAAQDGRKPAYLDPGLPAEQRAADLVRRMTLDEKVSQTMSAAAAIPRFGGACIRLV